MKKLILPKVLLVAVIGCGSPSPDPNDGGADSGIADSGSPDGGCDCGTACPASACMPVQNGDSGTFCECLV